MLTRLRGFLGVMLTCLGMGCWVCVCFGCCYCCWEKQSKNSHNCFDDLADLAGSGWLW